MVPKGNETDDGEVGLDTTSFEQVQQQQKKLVIGYALTSKKKMSFLQPKLEVLARKKGISFVSIDQDKPLSEQGPFDVVLHKLLGNEWHDVIEDYQQKHPEVTVLDPPCAIQRIYNRQSMLQGIADINLADCDGMICVPKQMVVLKDTTSSANEVAEAGLKFPLVAKPLLVDGTAKSHQLFLAYDHLSLAELEPPLVLQEFVNHGIGFSLHFNICCDILLESVIRCSHTFMPEGGVLFKVFVVGDVIKVVRRFSLPNVSNCEKDKVAGVFQFPRVSSSAASVDKTDLDPRVAELPPKPLLEGLVRELRNRLGLRLFNIDMIREHGSRDVFYVIDINYFPGMFFWYGKMPDYEQVFIDFFMSLAQAKHNKIQCVS
ncbi:hypothetical protein ARALYDRAFT_343072 [Arabidopsis lyrata subsp. lyrata]|uniref:Inositol-tetrakisphosphate 1-kinase n=1 Tax=Arabidopsis lyrata subsp. lyrata TaxID=81972 RepID=D7L2N2_ARALL|nr:hypothetical protein ARALYDRAFT_343072 [Arabidopsis lyrata subsp. lyrata]